jgi:hypothetical protein
VERASFILSGGSPETWPKIEEDIPPNSPVYSAQGATEKEAKIEEAYLQKLGR